jgi:O-antigen ligase
MLALLGYMGWMVLSSIQAYDSNIAWMATESIAKIVLPFVVGITIINSFAKLRALAWVIMLSQGYVAYDLNRSYFAGYNRLHDVGFGGMDNNCVAIAMVCGAGFAFFLGLAESGWRRWLAFFAAALMAHAVMFAFSRGGLLALIIAGVVSFLLIPKRPVDYFYLLLALLLALRMAGPEVRNRFYSTFAEKDQRDTSAQSRVDMWKTCMDLMSQHALLGIGPNNFPVLAQQYDYTAGKQAHSLWMQAGAELGVPGLGLLLGFYLVAMFRLWRLAMTIDPVAPDIANSCRMVIAALVGFMVAAQFVSLVGLEIPYYVNLVGAGYLRLCGTFTIDELDLPAETDLHGLTDARVV